MGLYFIGLFVFRLDRYIFGVRLCCNLCKTEILVILCLFLKIISKTSVKYR